MASEPPNPAIGSQRQRSDALVERSKALCEIGRWKDGEKFARQAIAADPEHERGILQLAHAVLNQGRTDEAAAIAKAALGRNPLSDWACRILASAAAFRGCHSEAVRFAEQAVRVSQGNNISLATLSQRRWDAGDAEGARRTAEMLVAAFPDWAYSHFQLARTRHTPEEATRAYREALRLDPQFDDAIAGLAELSGSLAMYREAVALSWSALRADPADTGRQRLFARSAWLYLFLSRIATPMRPARHTLAEAFGDACAAAFIATGDNTWRRIWLAFRGELLWVIGWAVIALGRTALSVAPQLDPTEVLFPLLSLAMFAGLLAVPVFAFRIIGAARRLLDFRIAERAGRRIWRGRLLRLAVSGPMLAGAASAGVMLAPAAGPVWDFAIVIAVYLTAHDVLRWRDEWRDARRSRR